MKRFVLLIPSIILTCLAMGQTLSPPSNVTATPQNITVGESSNLNATTNGDKIIWYLVPNGGDPIGTVNSGEDFTVSPEVATYYYAEAFQEYFDLQIASTIDNAVNGVMFNVKSRGNEVVIDGFPHKTNCGTLMDVKIYYKTGTYEGFADNLNAWTYYETCPQTLVDEENSLANLDINDFTLEPNEQIAFYLFCDEGEAGTVFRYASQNTTVSDTEIEINAGVITYYLNDVLYHDDNKSFVGSVRYKKDPPITSDTRSSVKVGVGNYPTEPASDILVSNITEDRTSYDLTWTNGNGNARAVFMKGEEIIESIECANPEDNTSYTANAEFGSGDQIGSTEWYCVYNGLDSNLTVTGLTDKTDYLVHVVEYKTINGQEKYLTSEGNNNPMIASTWDWPVVTTQEATKISYTTATGNYTVEDPGELLVSYHGFCWSTSPEPTTYDDCESVEEHIAGGTRSYTANLTELEEGTKYYTRAYVIDDFTGMTYYGNQQSFWTLCNTPSNQATAIHFYGTDLQDFSVQWTKGDGAAKAVFVKQGTSGTASPVDNTTYAASAEFGSGDQIGSSGWYCVYNGTNNYANVTGLNESTNYVVHVIEYNGGVGSEMYLTSSAAGNPKSVQTHQLPTVTTSDISNIAGYSATLNGSITDLGNPNPIEHGYCWSTSPNPDLNDNKTSLGAVSSPGTFASDITGLLPGQTYYVRAYAVNTSGNSFGSEKNFTTLTSSFWTGATSTDWNTGSNWNDGNVPTSTVDVIIPSGCTHYPEIDEAANCQNITIENNGTLTINSNHTLNVTGDFTLNDGGDFTNNGTLKFSGTACELSDNRTAKSSLGDVTVKEVIF